MSLLQKDETLAHLTETVRMCVPLPLGAVAFEHLFLFVRDRRRVRSGCVRNS